MADRSPTEHELPASIDALLASATNASYGSIPESGAKCCCGREDCLYLKHNTEALDDLEKKVRTAAGLGHALLIRHEQYIIDAELERTEMSGKISKLEDEKKDLELQNSRTIAENRGLLDQLEQLNTTAEDAEAQVKSLEATLHSAQQELKKLDLVAARAQRLETHAAELELEQDVLQTNVAKTKQDEQSALRRYQEAERQLSYLEDQLETIEQEAKEERERHAVILARMEQQRAMQKQLDTAAGRLKGAAVATSISQGTNHVVSNFVKDILQDNANMSVSIMELRELLSNSNDEVQHLRDRLMEHQPMMEGFHVNQGVPRTLQQELECKEPTINQELHVHHHYHPVTRPALKKKRVLINTTPTPATPKSRSRSYGRIEDTRTPRNLRSPDFTHRAHSAAGNIIPPTCITIPSTPAHAENRWSTQTTSTYDFAPSSTPSSAGGSIFRNSMLFDMNSRIGCYGDDESRPTSPGSSVDGFMSPGFNPHQRKRSSIGGRSCNTPSAFIRDHAIQEEGDDEWNADIDDLGGLKNKAAGPESRKQKLLQRPNVPTLSLEAELTAAGYEDDCDESSCGPFSPDHSDFDRNATPRILRRTTSHESIISVSGLDIHTLKSRPHQVEIWKAQSTNRRRGHDGSVSQTPSLVSSTLSTTVAVIGASDATATGVLASSYGLGSTSLIGGSARRVSSSVYLREQFFAAGQRSSLSSRGSNHSQSENSGGLGKKVGVWLSSRLGVSPSPSHSSLASASREFLRTHLDVLDGSVASSRASISSQASASENSVKSSSDSTKASSSMATLLGRSPGVNQKGPIPGWSSKPRESIKFQIEPETVNLEGLQDALREEES